MIDLTSPQQSFIRCAGSLGWGLPAALGAKCAAPDRPVVCFTGDGGMWYHLTELDTAARYGIRTVTVVNNNASLNQEQALNERIYGGVTPGSDRLWKLTDADFAAIAETMGCEGITVTRPSEMEGALGPRPVIQPPRRHRRQDRHRRYRAKGLGLTSRPQRPRPGGGSDQRVVAGNPEHITRSRWTHPGKDWTHPPENWTHPGENWTHLPENWTHPGKN